MQLLPQFLPAFRFFQAECYEAYFLLPYPVNPLSYVAYEVALNNVSMRNALVKSGVPFVNLPGNVFLPFMGIVLQDVYRKQR